MMWPASKIPRASHCTMSDTQTVLCNNSACSARAQGFHAYNFMPRDVEMHEYRPNRLMMDEAPMFACLGTALSFFSVDRWPLCRSRDLGKSRHNPRKSPEALQVMHRTKHGWHGVIIWDISNAKGREPDALLFSERVRVCLAVVHSRWLASRACLCQQHHLCSLNE